MIIRHTQNIKCNEVVVHLFLFVVINNFIFINNHKAKAKAKAKAKKNDKFCRATR